MKSIPVLIVGAGPTGLVLACELARRNIPFLIIDRLSEYPRGSRAKGIQPRTLEVFDDLGVYEKVEASSFTDMVFRRFQGPKLVAETKRQMPPREDSRFFQSYIVPQWRIEEILRERLAELGGKVELGSELVDLSQTESGVTAVFQTATGQTEIACDYLVGTDGGKSTVRKKLGIGFVGETHEEERMLVGDVEVEGLKPDAWHTWIHPVMPFGFALCPFRVGKAWQLQAIIGPDANGQLPEPSLDTFNRVFLERTGMNDVHFKNATWQSIYRVNLRVAERYRFGRVFIGGDAAHAHSIAGGLGLNTGVQDAFNLGWKLAAVIRGAAHADLLKTYEEERKPIAEWTLRTSSDRQQAMTVSAKQGQAGFEKIATADTTQLNLHYRTSSLTSDLTDQKAKLKAGDRAPNVRTQNGGWLADHRKGGEFVVYGLGDAQDALGRIQSHFDQGVKTVHVTDPQVVKAWENRSGLFVVRPDGYIGLSAPIDTSGEAVGYLEKFVKPVAN